MIRCLRTLLALALALAATAAHAVPCPVGTLEFYVDTLAACEIGTTAFSGFQSPEDVPTGATPIDPATILVTPVVTPSSPGFTFLLNRSAATPEFFDRLVNFQVAVGGGIALTGASASLTDATAAPDGSVSLIANLCLNGAYTIALVLCSSGSEAILLPLVNAFIDFPVDSTAFPGGIGALDVLLDFGIEAVAGAAHLGSATVVFRTSAEPAPVPEPATLALGVLALLLAGLVSRRRAPRS